MRVGSGGHTSVHSLRLGGSPRRWFARCAAVGCAGITVSGGEVDTRPAECFGGASQDIWPIARGKADGIRCAGEPGMASVERMLVWRLADELRRAIHELAGRPSVRRDVRFASQLQDSASGVPRNIAEGFGRISPREFARFLAIARGSLTELGDHLTEGMVRQHWTAAEIREARLLCLRTRVALDNLIAYLYTPEAARAAEAKAKRRPPDSEPTSRKRDRSDDR